MADIKTRDAVKGTIKTIDKAAIATERMKSAYAKTKDKAEQGCYADENSATEYAADRLSYGADRIKDEGIHQFNKQGQKAVKETRKNIGKAKDKISSYKQRKATKAAEQNNNGLQIRHGAASRSSAPDNTQRAKSQFIKTRQQGKKTIKTTARNTEKTVKATAKGTVKTTQKSIKTAQATSKAAIKTAEHTAKAAKAAAKASAKVAQRAAQAAKATAKATVAAVKAAVKATIAAVKAIIAGVKALVAAIAAGGWIAVVIIIVICLIALIAGSVFGIFFSGEDSGNGIDSGVIPKFAGCANGVQWFKDRGQWQDSGFEPSAGQIIFFDWECDGEVDHVGIVEKCENGIVYTVEGNSGDACRQKQYAVGSSVIYGYGVLCP